MKRLFMLCASLLLLAAGLGAQEATITIAGKPDFCRYNIVMHGTEGVWYEQATVSVGDTLLLVAQDDYEWKFSHLADSLGNTLSTSDTTLLVVSGDATLVAHFIYHPENPGTLPHAFFDPTSSTLTVEIMENSRSNPSISAGAALRLSGHTAIEVEQIMLLGYSEWLDLWWMNPYKFPNLHTLDLGTSYNGMRELDPWAFESWTELHTVILPASCERVHDYAFSNCTGLRDLSLRSTTPPTAGSAIFDNVLIDSLVITVPAEAYPTYMADTFWSSYNIRPDRMEENKTLSICFGSVITDLDGCTLAVTNDEGQTHSMTLHADSACYHLVLPNQAHYTLTVTSLLPETLAEEEITLVNDTTVMLNLCAVKATLSVCRANDCLTDQCYITWEDATDSTHIYGTGFRSPLMACDDSVRIRIVPMDQLAAVFCAKDTLVRVGDEPFRTWLTAREQNPAGRTPAGHLHAYSYSHTGAIGIITDSAAEQIMSRYGLVWNEAEQRTEFYAINMAPGHYNIIVLDEQHPDANAAAVEMLAPAIEEGYAQMFGFDIFDTITTHVDVEEIRPYSPSVDPEEGIYSAAISLKQNRQLQGNYNNLTFDVDLTQSPRALACSELQYHLLVPHSFRMVDGSVLVGLSLPASVTTEPYSATQNMITITAPLFHNKADRDATRMRLCFQMTEKGEFEIGGMISAFCDEQYHTATGASLSVATITLTAPEVVVYMEGHAALCDVQGIAPVDRDVVITRADGSEIGTAHSNGYGLWNTQIVIDNPEDIERINAHAVNYQVEMISDTAYIDMQMLSVQDADLLSQPVDYGFTHFNNWYHRPMPVRWYTDNCLLSTNYYYYYHDEDFTFDANFKGIPDSVVFVIQAQNGTVTRLPALLQQFNISDTTSNWAVTQHTTVYRMPAMMSVEYYLRSGLRLEYYPCEVTRAIADPSGYIYEAVSSNRVEGVTATIYTKENEAATSTLWDAAFYDQENPQTTDFAGRYGWDVPTGYWQVQFAKPGFEPMETEWLPVPPPQIEVNRPMVRLSAPVVESVQAYEDSIVLTFDRYMLPADMTTTNIVVAEVGAGAAALTGHITLLDEEARTPGDVVTFVRRVAYVADRAFGTTQVSITIGANLLHSYANIPMEAYSQSVAHHMAVESILAADTLRVKAGENETLSVSLLPAAAAAGMTLSADAFGSSLCTVLSSATVDAQGQAALQVSGLMAGTTQIRLALAGTDMQKYVVVVVTPADEPYIPTALPTIESDIRPSGTEKILEHGRLILLHNGRRYTILGTTME